MRLPRFQVGMVFGTLNVNSAAGSLENHKTGSHECYC